MPHPDRVTVAHDRPLTVHVLVRTAHTGLRYKLWTRQSAASAWTAAGDGISDDAAADHHELGIVSSGATFAYWFAVGGEAGASYHVDLAFLQGGHIVAGGICQEMGKVGDDEIAIAESRVVFP